MLGHLVYSRHALESGDTFLARAGWLRRLLSWLFHH